MNKIVMLLAGMLFLLSGPHVLAQQDAVFENREAILERAKEAVPQITVRELRQKIQDREDFVLLDVRDPDEWKAGVVDYHGLEKISRGMLEFTGPGVLNQHDRIVVLCATGARSSLAAESLIRLGYTNVLHVQGGIIEWVETGYPVKNRLGTLVKE